MKSEIIEAGNPVMSVALGREHRPPLTLRTRSFGLPAVTPHIPTPRFISALELAPPRAADAVTPYVLEIPARAGALHPGRAGASAVPAVSQARAPARGLSRRVFARAIAYMDEHLGDNFSLADLAKAAGVSRFHFARLFRVTTGASPMNFLLCLRIERAKRMLLEGNCRICEIAVNLGFFDQSHFSRVFRRMTGMTPGEYVRMAEVAEVAF